jgi:SAM-dependent methyltransferase
MQQGHNGHMSESIPQRPAPFLEGLVPTLNQRGFMADKLDRISAMFAEYAGSIDREVLDIGCAYGIATQAALEHGATVTACDMEAGHLQVLEAETPPAHRPRLTTTVGMLPVVDFEEGAYGAILCSRLLHFLKGDEITLAIRKMHQWLAPGGRLYLVADTPYTGFWFSLAERYEQRKAVGEEWPGFIHDIAPLLSGGQVPDGMLAYLNPLDPDILRRECERAGFQVIESEFMGRAGAADGRNHAGLIAAK